MILVKLPILIMILFAQALIFLTETTKASLWLGLNYSFSFSLKVISGLLYPRALFNGSLNVRFMTQGAISF